MSATPRGIRNFNPGNIDRTGTNKWQGLAADQSSDPRFCVFVNPVYGIRALARLLIGYQDKYGLNTVRKIIGRYAPPGENNTGVYLSEVAKGVGVNPDAPINTHTYKHLRPLVEAIIRHENGVGPLGTANSWYDEATINEALRMAGVKPEAVSPVGTIMPITKETVGATGTGVIGLAQLADVAPDIADALDKQQDNITSGQWVRIAFGVVTLAVAVFIAYAQVKKYQKGTL
jgi:hypothetical protein